MIKVNIILDYYKWKNKIKDPNNYLKKKSENYPKFLILRKKNKNFLYFLQAIKRCET